MTRVCSTNAAALSDLVAILDRRRRSLCRRSLFQGRARLNRSFRNAATGYFSATYPGSEITNVIGYESP